MTSRLNVGQRTTDLDLAQALRDEAGTFVCQQGGQTYIAVSQPGHSITALVPVGRRYNEPVSTTAGQEAWLIEKISNEAIPVGSELYGRDRERQGQRA